MTTPREIRFGMLNRRELLAWGVPFLAIGGSCFAGILSGADAPAPAAPPPAEDGSTGPGDAPVACPQCAGQGFIPCPVHCIAGKVRCPGNCLKPDDPRWQVMTVPGHDPSTKWITFPYHKQGENGSHRWSFAHCGQVVVYQGGIPLNIGVCPTCHGTCKVDCKTCKGLGHVNCPLCLGTKVVSPAKAAGYQEQVRAAHEKLAIHLLDGNTVYGTVIGGGSARVVIRTEDGKMVSVDIANVPESLRPVPAAASAGAAEPAAKPDGDPP